MTAQEYNFDGLVGPTHNYAGLSFGNLASEDNKGRISRPRDAVLQGLEKMRFVHSLGIGQALLPPLPRPHLPLLAALGFTGTDKQMLATATAQAPELLPRIYSASCMWTANAATISPSADTADGRLHFTAANLASHLHRSLEAPQTAALLHAIFADARHFAHHAPLPMQEALGDEGAANFMRFTPAHGQKGLEVLVFGKDGSEGNALHFPARQTQLASAAIFRLHAVANSLLIRQSTAAINAGVFHNDVIAVANENALLYHEDAFEQGEAAVDAMERAAGFSLIRLRLSREDFPLADAVKSYLFNSQLLTLPQGGMALIAPQEAAETPRVAAAIERLRRDNANPLSTVHFQNLRESMRNGGGPACLRLRVVLTEQERHAAHPGVFYSEHLHQQLIQWATRHYRESLAPADLADPLLMEESFAAQEALQDILSLFPALLGAFYERRQPKRAGRHCRPEKPVHPEIIAALHAHHPIGTHRRGHCRLLGFPCADGRFFPGAGCR